jgi:hypothetical protein
VSPEEAEEDPPESRETPSLTETDETVLCILLLVDEAMVSSKVTSSVRNKLFLWG